MQSNIVDQTHAEVNAILGRGYRMDKDGNLRTTEGMLTDREMLANGRETIGSIRLHGQVGSERAYRKQTSHGWAIKDSEADEFGDAPLTLVQEGDILPSMSKETTVASLLPNGEKYLLAGFNVMLIGLHGTGKTETVRQIAESLGMRMKYFSCATLDVYTDLVGVPTPRDWCASCKQYLKLPEGERNCPDCGGRTIESLQPIRPHDVDDAELIFFDEFNRADDKTLNAIFEIIQFRSLNGEPLSKLKACWAAMNPPDEEHGYTVNELDKALVDRFDLFVKIDSPPSPQYMAQFMPSPIANVLRVWWDNHKRDISRGVRDKVGDYISPRRLMKIGLVWCATESATAVRAAFPESGIFDKEALISYLRKAQEEVNAGKEADLSVYKEEATEEYDPVRELGERPEPMFEPYEAKTMGAQRDDLSAWLKKHPNHMPTHQKVVEGLRSGAGGLSLIKLHAPILDALSPSQLEGFISGLPHPKVKEMKNAFVNLLKEDPNANKYKELHKVLTSYGPVVDNWPKSL